MSDTSVKSDRLLHIYFRLIHGEILKKKDLMQQFHVTERSIQRDMEELRGFFSDQGLRQELIYDKSVHGYRVVGSALQILNNDEILAVCKILLESRSMRKDEMLPILDKLISCCVPEENKKAVNDLLSNEKHHYIEPHHGQRILDGLWQIGQAVQNHQVMAITYERMKEPHLVQRTIEPVGIMFSEYYFYLTAFLRDVDVVKQSEDGGERFPTIYRIDRIRSFEVLEERFYVPYKDRFQEGEFRKRVQFMYGGKLQKIRFKYTGPSIEAVLDRLPTAEIVSRDAEGWVLEAEVYGDGIQMWLRSQGNRLEVLSPVEYVDEF